MSSRPLFQGWRKWALQLLTGLLLLGFLFYRVDFPTLWLTAGRLDASFYLMLAFLYGLGVVVSAIKWRLLLPSRFLGTLIRLSLVGQFYGLLLPGMVAGEAVKAYKLGRGQRDAEKVAMSVIVDKITGLIALIFLGMIGLVGARPNIHPAIVDALLGAFILCLVALLAIRAGPVFRLLTTAVESIQRRLPKLRPISTRARFMLIEWREYANRPIALVASVILGALLQMLHLTIIVLLASRFDIQIPFVAWLWIFTLVSLAVVLPLSVGGIGVREGAFVGILATFGVPGATSLALSLTVFSLQLLSAIIGGLLEITGVTRRNS